MKTRVAHKVGILDFDIECRPLSWISSDYVSSEITAIAWKWVGTRAAPEVALLGRDDPLVFLEAFREAYNAAGIVTGHYIRGFDLPMLNGAFFELELPVLGDKYTQDTKNDLVRFMGMSKSQENMAATFDLHRKKAHMHQAAWRKTNRLLPGSMDTSGAEKRVRSDVHQHIDMRARLLKCGYLSPPRPWSSFGNGVGRYVP